MNNINNWFNNPADDWRPLFNSDQSDDTVELNASDCHPSDTPNTPVDNFAKTTVESAAITHETAKHETATSVFEESSNYSTENEESTFNEKSIDKDHSSEKTSLITTLFNKFTSFLNSKPTEGEEYDPISGVSIVNLRSEKIEVEKLNDEENSKIINSDDENDYVGSWDDQVRPNVQFPSRDDLKRHSKDIKRLSAELLPVAIVMVGGVMEAKRKTKNIDKLVSKLPILKKLGESYRQLSHKSYKPFFEMFKSSTDFIAKVLSRPKAAHTPQITADSNKMSSVQHETMLKELVSLKKQRKQMRTRSINKQLDYVIKMPKKLKSKYPDKDSITINDLLKEIRENSFIFEVDTKELIQILYRTKGVSKKDVTIILKTVLETNEFFKMDTRKVVNMIWFTTNALMSGLCQTYLGMSSLKYDNVVQWKNEAVNHIISHLRMESYKLHCESKDFVNVMKSHLKDLEMYPNNTEKHLLEKVIKEAIESNDEARRSIDGDIDQWHLSLHSFVKRSKSQDEITSVEFLKNVGVFALSPFTKNLISAKLPLDKMKGVRKQGAEIVSNTGVSLSTNAAKELTSEGANKRDVQLLLKELKILANSDISVMNDVKIKNVAFNTLLDVTSKVLTKVSSNETVKGAIAFKFKNYVKSEYSKNDDSKIKEEEVKALFMHTANEMIDIISRLEKNNRQHIHLQLSTLEDIISAYKTRQNEKQN